MIVGGACSRLGIRPWADATWSAIPAGMIGPIPKLILRLEHPSAFEGNQPLTENPRVHLGDRACRRHTRTETRPSKLDNFGLCSPIFSSSSICRMIFSRLPANCFRSFNFWFPVICCAISFVRPYAIEKSWPTKDPKAKIEPTTIAMPNSRAGPFVKISPAPIAKQRIWNRTNTCAMKMGEARRLIVGGPKTDSQPFARSQYDGQSTASISLSSRRNRSSSIRGSVMMTRLLMVREVHPQDSPVDESGSG